jgi:protein phosphatase PTC1
MRACGRLTCVYVRVCADEEEAKRIVAAGGFVVNGRVNGILAVSRAIGDTHMKPYVSVTPYT